MASTEDDDVPLLPAEVSEDTRLLAMRLALILERTRAEGRFNLEMFLLAGEKNMGGTLVIECPMGKRPRGVLEVRFAGSGFQLGSGLTALPGRD